MNFQVLCKRDVRSRDRDVGASRPRRDRDFGVTFEKNTSRPSGDRDVRDRDYNPDQTSPILSSDTGSDITAGIRKLVLQWALSRPTLCVYVYCRRYYINVHSVSKKVGHYTLRNIFTQGWPIAKISTATESEIICEHKFVLVINVLIFNVPKCCHLVN